MLRVNDVPCLFPEGTLQAARKGALSRPGVPEARTWNLDFVDVDSLPRDPTTRLHAWHGYSNLVPASRKLRERAVRLVASLGGVDERRAADLLAACDGSVRAALDQLERTRQS